MRVVVAAHPSSKVERAELLDDGTLGVWVRPRAIEGKANTAIEQVLAGALGLRPRQVRLVAGATSRRKIVDIDLPSLEALQHRLGARPRDFEAIAIVGRAPRPSLSQEVRPPSGFGGEAFSAELPVAARVPPD